MKIKLEDLKVGMKIKLKGYTTLFLKAAQRKHGITLNSGFVIFPDMYDFLGKELTIAEINKELNTFTLREASIWDWTVDCIEYIIKEENILRQLREYTVEELEEELKRREVEVKCLKLISRINFMIQDIEDLGHNVVFADNRIYIEDVR